MYIAETIAKLSRPEMRKVATAICTSSYSIEKGKAIVYVFSDNSKLIDRGLIITTERGK